MKTHELPSSAARHAPWFLGAALAASAALQAQSTWNGTTSNAWATAGNWSPAAVPADGANIVIADTTTNNTLNLDTSRAIGSLSFGTSGTRYTPQFTLNTQAANNLTIQGGVVANGVFGAANANSLLMRGHYTVPAGQTWSVEGSAAHNTDQGVFVREVTTGVTNRGSLTLNGDLTKNGAGQLSFAAIDVTGAGNLIVNAGDLKYNAGASQPLVVSGPGNVTLNGTAILAVYKNSGTMNLTRPIVLNEAAGLVARNSTVDIASPIAFNGAHTLDAGGTTNLSGAWTGGGSVNRIGAGTVTLAGDLSGFTGTLSIGAGITNLAGPLPVGLTINGGTANLGGAVAGDLALATGATVGGEVNVGGYLDLYGGTVAVDPSTPAALHTAKDLTLSGTVAVSLAGAPPSTAPFPIFTYAGSLFGAAVDHLTLVGGATNYRTPVFDDTTAGVITLSVGSETRTWNGGVAWDINTSSNWLEGDHKFYQLDAVIFGDTAAGTVTLSGALTPASVTVDSTKEYLFSAAAGSYIAGAGRLTKKGSGLLTISGVNTFTGGISLQGGTIKPSGNQALGANGNAITVAAGATLDTNGAMNANRDYRAVIAGSGVDGNGAIVNSTTTDRQNGFGSIVLAADATIGGNARFDLRPISAGSALVDLAGFTLTKAGANKIALVDGVMGNPGNIRIDGGTLAITRMAVSGAGSIDVNAGATLQFENNATGSFNKELKVDGGLVLVTGNAFRVDGGVVLSNAATFQTDVALTVGGAISGTGSLVKTGAGALILEGDSSHGGGTTVTAGTLQLGNGGTTGSVAGDIACDGTVAFARSDDVSFGNLITGFGGLVQQGPGVLTIAVAQSYAGNTTVNGGTLRLGGDNLLPVATALGFANTAGAVFDLNGWNQEVRGLTGGGVTGGNVTNSGTGVRTLTLRPTLTDSFTHSGQIQGEVRVVVAGDKTAPSYTAPRQRFAGTTNTYTGGTLVDGTTLMARLDGSLGAVPAAFDAANITLQNSATLVNEADANRLVLDPNRGITLGTGGGALVGGFNSGITVQGAISGAAGIALTIVENNGNVVFAGNNTYLGDTILQGPGTNGIGRLQVGDGGTSGTLGAGKVVNDGALGFNRSDELTVGNAISGTGTVTQLGTGTLVLAGINTYTGNTSVNAGTLRLADNASLAFAVADTTNTKIAGNGTGALVLDGDFTIDTSAVTVATGSWTLVDTATVATTVGATFTLAGTGWSQASPGVWAKSEGSKKWTYTAATGQLALATGGGFDAWMAGFDFSAFPGADLTPAGDADLDGISNAVEMVVGNLPNQTKVVNLPTIQLVTDPAGVPAGSYLKFSYRRSTASVDAGAGSAAQYDSDLAGPWTSAANGVDGVTVIETPNAAIPGHDVDVYIPRGLAVDGKLFGRLAVTVP